MGKSLKGRTMKKVILSLLILLVLTWSCDTVFAQGKSKGKGKGRQDKQADKVEEKKAGKGKAVEKNAGEPKGKGKGKVVETDAGKGKGKGKGKAAEKDTARDKDRGRVKAAEKDTAKGRGKGHQQQLKALEAQMFHEEAKHVKRVARLERIRELAAEEGNTKTVARVDKLLGKERQRYDRKLQRMQERKHKILQLAEGVGEDTEEAAEKTKGKGKGKGKGRDKGKEKSEDDDEDKDEDAGEKAEE